MYKNPRLFYRKYRHQVTIFYIFPILHVPPLFPTPLTDVCHHSTQYDIFRICRTYGQEFKIDNSPQILYYYDMNKNNSIIASEDSRELRPICRITADSGEDLRLIEAILCDTFTFGESGAAVSVECSSDELVIRDRAGEIYARLCRPFSFAELRAAAHAAAEGSTPAAPPFSANAELRLAICGGTSVKLTPTEFRLYSAMLDHGDFASAAELSRAVWGDADENRLAVYICYLRRKLDSALGDGSIITSSGNGYRLRGAVSGGSNRKETDK